MKKILLFLKDSMYPYRSILDAFVAPSRSPSGLFDKVGIFSVSQMSETLAALVRYVRVKIRHAHKN